MPPDDLNLLVVNFEMNRESPALAWQCQVVQALAPHCRHLVVVTEQASDVKLPANVTLWVMPRWYAKLPWRWCGAKWLANAHVYALCKRFAINACFVHMNMEWSYRLSLCLRYLGIPILLWYAHGSVTTRLRLAHWRADRVVTSTRDGFRIPSNKVRTIGQGIDTKLFRPAAMTKPTGREIITVGRISARKGVETMIDVATELRALCRAQPISLVIYGAALTRRDRQYVTYLQALIQARGLQDRVRLAGPVPHAKLPDIYRKAALLLNLSATGSMDKVVLEALACGCPVITSNEAFVDLFRKHGLQRLLVVNEAPVTIARRILDVCTDGQRPSESELRAVALEHDLKHYVRRLLSEIERLRWSKHELASSVWTDNVRRPEGGA